VNSVHSGHRARATAPARALFPSRFYVALGFSVIGGEFELKDIGPHYLMARGL
jgi:hypothetical protein